MEHLIDLTAPEFQGCFGHDIVEELNTPGFYRIPLRNYDKEEAFDEEREKRLRKIADEMNASNTEKGEYTSLMWYTLPEEIQKEVHKSMVDEGWEDHDNVDVHIDKVLFLRDGAFQVIHTTDPDIFTESGWAYYNGAEQNWKYCICLEEIMEEVLSEVGIDRAEELLGEYYDETIAKDLYYEDSGDDSDDCY